MLAENNKPRFYAEHLAALRKSSSFARGAAAENDRIINATCALRACVYTCVRSVFHWDSIFIFFCFNKV